MQSWMQSETGRGNLGGLQEQPCRLEKMRASSYNAPRDIIVPRDCKIESAMAVSTASSRCRFGSCLPT